MIIKNANPFLLDTLTITNNVICIYDLNKYDTSVSVGPKFLTIPANNFIAIYENWIALDNRNFAYHLDHYGPVLKLEVAKIEQGGNIFVYNNYFDLNINEYNTYCDINIMKENEFKRLVFIALNNQQSTYASSYHFIPGEVLCQCQEDLKDLDKHCPIYEHTKPIADPSIEKINQFLSEETIIPLSISGESK